MTQTPPPPNIVIAAENDYRLIRNSLANAVAGARLLAAGRGSEVEVFVDVYHALSQLNAGPAAGMGAAAIVQLAMSPNRQQTKR